MKSLHGCRISKKIGNLETCEKLQDRDCRGYTIEEFLENWETVENLGMFTG